MNFNLRIILHVCFTFYFVCVCLFVLYSALIWIHDYALNKNQLRRSERVRRTPVRLDL